MAEPKQPSIRVVFDWDRVDGSGTDTFRWSTVPLADPDFFTEGRVVSFSEVERRASTPDGDYSVSSGSVVLTDGDGLFRGRMSAPETRYPTARECRWEVLSQQQRAIDPSEWRTLWHGRISDAQPIVGRKFSIEVADEVGSHFTGFDLEKIVGVRMTEDIFEGLTNALPDESVNRIFPIVLGEHSDIGAVNENGEPADKGLLPVIDAGVALLFGDGSFADAASVTIPLLTPPNLQAPVLDGDGGSTDYNYVVTALTEVGETYYSATATVQDGPDILNATDSITLTWGPEEPGLLDGATGFRVYRNGFMIAEVDADVDTYTDVGAPATGRTLPNRNTAQLPGEVDGEEVIGWHMLVMKIGAASEIFHVYASDISEEGGDGTSTNKPARRVRMPESVYGVEFLVYGRPGYPHAEPYIESGGVRFAVMYARGPRMQAHLDGVVTIAWNGCGDDDVGDGSGLTITEYFRGMQHFLNEYVLKDNGVGYRTGTFGPLEEYANAVPKLKTSAYELCQEMTVEWIGERGYQIAWTVIKETSLRECLRQLLVSASCHLCVNHHGQIYPFLIPSDTTEADAGRHYRDRIEVKRLVGERIEHEEAITRVVYHYDWDSDAQQFRVTDRIAEDLEAEAAQTVPREKSERDCRAVRDEATAVDAQTRHLYRYTVAPRYITFTTNLLGLEDENGGQVRWTHYDTCGGENGDEETPAIVVGHAFGFDDDGPEVTITLFDLSRVSTAIFPALEDEGTMVGNLGDEESFALPPAGAFELN